MSEIDGSNKASAPSLAAALGRLAAVRDVDAASYFETFLVSAVASLLLIRLYLELTDYPRIGSGGLHIAHVLWGGALMLLAIVLLLGFLGKHVKRSAAIVGGAGFGAFIDELGKFITSDNNYFYRPTAALIYVIFIGLFLALRSIERRRRHSKTELLVNAADMLKEVVIDGARSDEIHRALALLERSGDTSELARALHRAVHAAERVPDRNPSLPARAVAWGRRIYESLLTHRWFRRAVLFVFTANAAAGIVVVLLVLLSDALSPVLADDDRSLATLALAAAATLVWVLTIIGTVRLRRSRLAAYQWFKRSVLIMIFFVQVFLFMQSHFAALVGLTVNLLLLVGINGMIRAEQGHLDSQLQPSSAEARRTL
jgi:hypothetical protein